MITFVAPLLLGLTAAPGPALQRPGRTRPRAQVQCVADCDLFEFDLGASTPSALVRLGLAETADLDACVDVLMGGFYKDALTLAAESFSEEEMQLLGPPLSRVNVVLERFTRFMLKLTTAGRCGQRLMAPSARDAPPNGNSLMVCAHRPSSGEVVGVVEISIEPRDGRVPSDIRPLEPPWSKRPRVAYVSNLAVAPGERKWGLGSRLLRAAEGLAAHWGYEEVYLHAAANDTGLLQFYAGQEYRQLPEFDAPGWVLASAGREQTRYHYRVLDSSPVERLAAAAGSTRAGRKRTGS